MGVIQVHLLHGKNQHDCGLPINNSHINTVIEKETNLAGILRVSNINEWCFAHVWFKIEI